MARKKKLDGELYRGKCSFPERRGHIRLVVIQRPPMHRTVFARKREYHILLPYTQSYVFFETTGPHYNGRFAFRRFSMSMTKSPITDMSDVVFGCPFYDGFSPKNGYCMGPFSPRHETEENLVYKAIAHFWQSDFGSDSGISDWQYLTKMGNTVDHIFDSYASSRSMFSSVCHSMGLIPGGLLQWEESKLEQV